jgi:predicted thioesterase
MPVETGLAGRVSIVVTEADTAISMGSGSVPVLATPRLAALCEAASLVALGDRVVEPETTVGMRIQIDHLAPTGLGQEVTAEATLDKVEGRRLVFHVSVTDHRGLVAAGKVTRVIVDRSRFMEKVH